MKNINNLYNFKNPIRHFLNLDNINEPQNIEIYNLENLSWTAPIKFRIRKTENSYRTLKFPNILNFLVALYKNEKDDNFYNIPNLDHRKRMVPNLNTGDFKSNSYSENLEKDFNKLCIYDSLLKLDIKSFYGRLYLHEMNFNENERYISNMNKGRTNEVILGNYISLYIAEKFLSKLSDELNNALNDKNIDCKLSYFSDDFYFFCNKADIEKVIKIFDQVLEKHELEKNNDKIDIWSYDDYSDYNLVEKYWKKIVSEDKIKIRSAAENSTLNFYFINQLIYRKSKLKDIKLQRVFINNFFKSTHFNKLEWNRYELQDFNCHQLFSMFKFSPEILLYTINRFKNFEIFVERIKSFLKVRYKIVLDSDYYDEQLYYFYAIKSLGFKDILVENKQKILKGNNQILKSYYLLYNYFDLEDIKLTQTSDEEQWFFNYHVILFESDLINVEEEIKKYLIPQYANKEKQIKSYMDFYLNNIKNNIWLIKDIDEVQSTIQKYINLKIDERIGNKEENIDSNIEVVDENFELNYLG